MPSVAQQEQFSRGDDRHNEDAEVRPLNSVPVGSQNKPHKGPSRIAGSKLTELADDAWEEDGRSGGILELRSFDWVTFCAGPPGASRKFPSTLHPDDDDCPGPPASNGLCKKHSGEKQVRERHAHEFTITSPSRGGQRQLVRGPFHGLRPKSASKPLNSTLTIDIVTRYASHIPPRPLRRPQLLQPRIQVHRPRIPKIRCKYSPTRPCGPVLHLGQLSDHLGLSHKRQPYGHSSTLSSNPSFAQEHLFEALVIVVPAITSNGPERLRDPSGEIWDWNCFFWASKFSTRRTDIAWGRGAGVHMATTSLCLQAL
ncbi:hypothetical protein CC78DRAFT_576164 [Lojkania enalia]|uniref:Uncharacterized protein n=1 Tax=Lojkania enalia TaxID=147567 RepID=A0A9P4KHC1_9PLEO|nr:hypothetical protein CC78DRAFT_576164 [Didymosphaeria enalia]